MSTPVLHVVAGPNGAGKTTLVRTVLWPAMSLPFINADEIAARHWPGAESEHAYAASQLAATERDAALDSRRSFITETVFSHPSKLDLLREAIALGYVVTLHAVLIPVELSVARVSYRVRRGGHEVPEVKIRERYDRLWPLVADGAEITQHARFYDNSRAATPFRSIATFERGRPIGTPVWPTWTPPPLGSAP